MRVDDCEQSIKLLWHKKFSVFVVKATLADFLILNKVIFLKTYINL